MSRYLTESGNNEWYTPPHIVSAARQALGGSIEFDPFSCEIANNIVQAEHYFTKEDDALQKEWASFSRVFVNPPYQRGLIDKCVTRCVAYHTHNPNLKSRMCILVNVSSETKWFQLLLNTSRCVCFFTRRIRFVDSQGNPSKGNTRSQAMFYYAPPHEHCRDFYHAFDSYGIVMSKYHE